MAAPQDDLVTPNLKQCELTISKLFENKIKPKINPRIHDKVLHLIKHVLFLIKTLNRRINSYQNGLQVLVTLSEELTKDLKQKLLTTSVIDNDIKRILVKNLTIWFKLFVRLRDGAVLCTSGECRHEGDRLFARKFKSYINQHHLNKQLYKEDAVYSGAGWDEFFDENAGLRTRLINLLQSESKYERLIEQPCSGLFDNLEQRKEVADRKLEATARDFEGIVRRVLSGHNSTIEIKSRDKFECLTMKVKGKDVFGIGRQGNDFQINDKNGALPDRWSYSDWNRSVGSLEKNWSLIGSSSRDSSFKVSTAKNAFIEEETPLQNKTKKKRKILVDDSSDDDEGKVSIAKHRENHASDKSPTRKKKITHSIAPDKSLKYDGLKVKVADIHQTRDSSPMEAKDVSVRDIKETSGVNVTALETSREVLEAESRGSDLGEILSNGTSSKGFQSLSQEAFDLSEDIKTTKEEILQVQRYLRKASNERDPNAVWNAMDLLREKSMVLGSALRKLAEYYYEESSREIVAVTESANTKKKRILDLLEESEDSYNLALKWIDGLWSSYGLDDHDAKNAGQNDTFNTLLLLQGRAQVNIGLVCFDQHELVSSNLKPLCRSLKALRDVDRTIRPLLSNNITTGRNSNEPIATNIIAALSVMAMSRRCLGQVLWNLGKRSEGSQVLNELSTDDDDLAVKYIKSAEHLLEVLDIYFERYFAAVNLLTLAQKRSLEVSSGKEELKSLIDGAYEAAAKMSRTIYNLKVDNSIISEDKVSSLISDFVDEREIPSFEEILNATKQFIEKANDRTIELSKGGNNKSVVQKRDQLNVSSIFRAPPTAIFSLDRRRERPFNSDAKKAVTGDISKVRKRRQMNWPSLSSLFRPNEDGSASNGIENGQLFGDLGALDMSNHEEKVVYFKWGDELLENPNRYPACAPPMPDDW